MDREEFLNTYWRYYESLESDFRNTIRYVSLDEDNYNTYSIEYARLLQAICSEIDVIFKDLCNIKDGKIGEYAKIIEDKYTDFKISVICLKMYHRGFEIKPFCGWDKDNPPVWWTAYNKIKHHRKEQMKKANLENVLYSLSALFLLENYLLSKVISEGNEKFTCVDYPSELFYIKKFS